MSDTKQQNEFIISEEEINSNKDFIISQLQSTERPGMERLIAWIESTDFFTAPASTKYHLHCRGGLAKHSINVYERLKAKVDSGLVELKSDTIIITALLHDLCKANFYTLQKRNRKIDGVWKEIDEWGIDDKFPVGHGEKSCYLIQSCIRLTPEEYAMIRHHMGRETNQNNDPFSQCAAVFPGVAAIHTADLESAFIIERRM